MDIEGRHWNLYLQDLKFNIFIKDGGDDED